ncbi:MAG: hypothetical protein ACK5UX_04790, partial [Burkholderiales bacterium]
YLERLPDLRLDGDRPTSKSLAVRLAALWWPGSSVLYVGSSARTVGGRLKISGGRFGVHH